MRTSLATSPSISRDTGMPVHRLTTSATSSASTSSLSMRLVDCSSARPSAAAFRDGLQLGDLAVAQAGRGLQVGLPLDLRP